MTIHKAAAVLFTLAMVATSPSHAQQPPTAADLQGAWVEQGASCADVFESRNGKLAFRRPVDAFAPAFIIAGKKLRTPLATCNFVKASSGSDRANISLSCANAVSVDSVQLVLTLKEPGVLIRQLGLQGEMRSGTAYLLCKP